MSRSGAVVGNPKPKLTREDGRELKRLIQHYVTAEVDTWMEDSGNGEEVDARCKAAKKALYDYIGKLTGDNLSLFMGTKTEK